jgi:hydroxylamine reductase
MFCYQCEQTSKGQGCTVNGVCGKTGEVAALQDLLIYALKGLAMVANEGRKVGISDLETDRLSIGALFATLTNVNFDGSDVAKFVERVVEARDALKKRVDGAGGWTNFAQGPATFIPLSGLAVMASQGAGLGVLANPELDADIRALRELLTYGLKGVAAYAYHAASLGQEDARVYAFIHEALAATVDHQIGVPELLSLALRCGEINLRAMELLDAGNTSRFGHPVPTQVPLGAKKGKAILVSGHDLLDLEAVLKQTQGTGISVYTHGEMLPAHGYPVLKAYPHFYGHYGTAWQNQTKEFGEFPGAILMTTNCLQPPRDSYRDNLFTTGVVGWPGVSHISGHDFTPLIQKALAMPGFDRDLVRQNVTVGFARQAVLGVAAKVIDAVKAKKISRFYLVGGCDGAKTGRNYYTEFVQQAPKDSVILTLGCGKYRFFDQDLGNIEGIPRLLDVGQCNDAYSAIQIAGALANAFNCGVNDLPLSLVLSWYEQKAVAILLSLLHLGIRNIRLGPTLPAFITPSILQVLVDKFAIRPVSTPAQDLKDIQAVAH